jgi:hypothetical protein
VGRRQGVNGISVRFSPLSRPSSLDPRSRETANGPEIWYLGPMHGPKIPRSWSETRVIDNSQVHQYCSFDNEKKNLCDRRWSSGGHNSFDTRCKRTRRNACGAWRRADTLAETLAVVETIDEIRAQLKTPLLELDSVLWKQYPYPSR